ncbi:MAG TPA: serine hydrolase domain-containing protein [Vicinamibacterales bacterium]|nr:serine hydrolase domain-containing protein [Vicinamibacterales bacterium]
MRFILGPIAIASCLGVLDAQDAGDPYPRSLDEFRQAVQTVLVDAEVPGAGIALVRTSGVEWAGGVGVADRELRTPVTADTHFRAGSISKTFVAAALVQMYLDDEIELDAPVAELAPEIDIDNAWEGTDPVRVIHLLQHTAGFDDMHFNEMYNLTDPPDLPLEQVLRRNPASRVVRWRPGTRMSYSNPGYGVAGYLIEKLTGQPFEDRIAERIFTPAGMPTSSFRLTTQDEAAMAKGYRAPTGPPVPYLQIYLRPAGNLHTSPLELGRFVHLLLNWGETETDLVIDPEYLSNMEHPRTTLASLAGLRNGYGSGIASLSIEGFPMLGHGGGIEGFISQYAYSTARDVGFVVMLNATHAPAAMQRISALAVRYLKADVAPPEKTKVPVDAATLDRYTGYYHDANPRHQAFAFIDWLASGRTIRVDGDQLRAEPVFGRPAELIPVSETLFRFDADPEPSRVFVPGDGDAMILTGGGVFAERRPRWRIDIVRWPVLASAGLLLTPVAMLIVWTGRALILPRRVQAGYWPLKLMTLGCSLGLLLPVVGMINVAPPDLGTRNAWTIAVFTGSVLLPVAAVVSFLYVVDAWRTGAGLGFRLYTTAVSIAALVVSGYLSAWGMIGFRPWTF